MDKAANETGSRGVASPAPLIATATDFARAVASSPEFRAYEAATRALSEDAEARALLDQCRELRDRLNRRGGLALASPEERTELERREAALLRARAVMAQQAAYADLAALLRELALEISEKAGIDFGKACARTGECCG